jgi:transcriptional regulator with XRE-family HTH domain
MDFSIIKRTRKLRGMTIGDISKKTGIGRDSISYIEKGTGNPTIKTLEIICECLDMDIILLEKCSLGKTIKEILNRAG